MLTLFLFVAAATLSGRSAAQSCSTLAPPLKALTGEISLPVVPAGANCSWLIAPEPPPASITIILSSFQCIVNADGLLVRDGASGALLATFSGDVPAPHAARFNASSLMITLEMSGVRDGALHLSYLADGSCYRACAGGGRCDGGLCRCPARKAGADCSLDLSPLDISHGAATSTGRLQPGGTAYFELRVPSDALLLVELTWSKSADETGLAAQPSPLLMLSNASSPCAVSSTFMSQPDGSCDETTGCGWSVDAGGCVGGAMQIDGPAIEYSLVGDDGITRLVRMPAIPTQALSTRRDTAGWAGRAQRCVPAALSRFCCPSRAVRHTIALNAAAGSAFRLGVANARPNIRPPYVPAYEAAAAASGNSLDGLTAFGADGPGYEGGSAAMYFTIRVAASTDAAAPPCPSNCSGAGMCLAGTCSCRSQMAGAACDAPVTTLQPSQLTRLPSLPPSSLTHFYFALDPASAFNAMLIFELAHPDEPALAPVLVASRASTGPVTLGLPDCRVAGPSAGNVTWLDEACLAAADLIVADFHARAEGTLEEAAGAPYQSLALQPETHLLQGVAPNASSYEAGYYISVFAPNGAANGTLQLRATARPAAAQAAQPACPLDCLGRGTCTPPPDYAAFAAAGTSTVLAGACVCAGTPASEEAPPPNGTQAYAGLFCEDGVAPLQPSGARVNGSVLSGGWAHFYVDAAASDAASPSFALFRLDAQVGAAGPSPLLLLKRGAPPRAASLVYSLAEESVFVDLAASGAGAAPAPASAPAPSAAPAALPAGGVLGAAGNTRALVRGLPFGARVTGLSFDGLLLQAHDAEAAAGACFALEAARGTLDVACPLLAGGAVQASDANASVVAGMGYARLLRGRLPLSADLSTGGGSRLAVEAFLLSSAEGGSSLATWGGNTTLQVSFLRPVDRGFDQVDLTSRACAASDCSAEAPRLLAAALEPGRTFLSVFWPPPAAAGTAPPPPLAFGLTYTRANNLSTACFGDCGPHGRCGGSSAPYCTCDDGWLGLDCSIHATPLPVPQAAAAAAANASGELPAGRFAYYNLSLPMDDDVSMPSLLITLSYPTESGATPRLFLRAGGSRLPLACSGTAPRGLAPLACRDEYDLSDATDEGGLPRVRLPASDAVPALTQAALAVSTRGGGAAAALLAARAASGLVLAVANPPSGGQGRPLRYLLEVQAVPGALCPGAAGNCSGHGACSHATGRCTCFPGWDGEGCQAPVFSLAAGQATVSAGGGEPPPQLLLSWSVNCSDQAANLTVAAASGGHDWALLLRHGAAPSASRQLYQAAGVALPAPGGGGVASVVLPAVLPGTWVASVVPLDAAGAPQLSGRLRFSALNASLTLSPGRVPNDANGCSAADGALQLRFSPAENQSAWVLDGPATGSVARSDLPESPPAAAYELAAVPGACAPELGCYIGARQSSGRDIGAQSSGRGAGGAVAGLAAVAVSAPAPPNAAAFYYLQNDPRKHLGAPPSQPPAPLLAAFAAGASDAWDMEACSLLSNAAAVAAAGVCVAVRGGCSFTTKVVHCQQAGARLALIINNNAAEGADNTWLLTAEQGAGRLRIPAVSISSSDGARLLSAMVASGAAQAGDLRAAYAARRVLVNATTASCAPAEACLACAPGLAAPSDACSAARCPGMSPTLAINCSAHGVCRAAAADAFSCTCRAGWTGGACDISTQPPLFTGQPPTSLQVSAGQRLRLRFHAYDPAGGVLTYSLKEGPPGVVVQPDTGLLIVPPNATALAAGGTVPLAVAATTAAGLSATARVELSLSGGAQGGGGNETDDQTPSVVPTDAAGHQAASSRSDSGHSRKSSSSSHRRLDAGAIAGIVIAVVASVALGALGLVTCRSRRSSIQSRAAVWSSARRHHTQLVEF